MEGAASLSSDYSFQLKKKPTLSVWLSHHHHHHHHPLRGTISVVLQGAGFLSLFFSLGVLCFMVSVLVLSGIEIIFLVVRKLEWEAVFRICAVNSVDNAGMF